MLMGRVSSRREVHVLEATRRGLEQASTFEIAREDDVVTASVTPVNVAGKNERRERPRTHTLVITTLTRLVSIAVV